MRKSILLICLIMIGIVIFGCSKEENSENEFKNQKTELEILEENLPYFESEESKLVREHNQKMLGFDSSKEDEYRKQLQERKKNVWVEMGWKENVFQSEQEREYVEEFTDPNNRKFQLYLVYNIYDFEHEGNKDLIRAYAEIIYDYDFNYLMRFNSLRRLAYIEDKKIIPILMDCINDYDSNIIFKSIEILYYFNRQNLAYLQLYEKMRNGLVPPRSYFAFRYPMNIDKEFYLKLINNPNSNYPVIVRSIYLLMFIDHNYYPEEKINEIEQYLLNCSETNSSDYKITSFYLYSIKVWKEWLKSEK